MINKVHEQALRVVLNDHTSDFKMHRCRKNHRNIQNLLIEIFETKMILLLRLWDLCLKGEIPLTTSEIPLTTSEIPLKTSEIPLTTSEIPLTTSEIFKRLRQKEQELYILQFFIIAVYLNFVFTGSRLVCANKFS